LSLLVILGLLGVVVGGVEEHGDPKEHKREGGKSKSTLKHEQNQSFHNNTIKCFSITYIKTQSFEHYIRPVFNFSNHDWNLKILITTMFTLLLLKVFDYMRHEFKIKIGFDTESQIKPILL
jgi:hypothetical protein